MGSRLSWGGLNISLAFGWECSRRSVGIREVARDFHRWEVDRGCSTWPMIKGTNDGDSSKFVDQSF